MNINNLYDRLLERARKEFGGLTIKKRSQTWWAGTVDKLWGTGQYTTTLGKTIAFPDKWETWSMESRYEVLSHEVEHLHQQKRLGLGLFWLGFLIYAFLSLFILPVVLTLRSVFEKGAYRRSAISIWVGLRLKQDKGIAIDMDREYDAYERMILKDFCGWTYLWMCPFRGHMKRWVQKTWDEARELAGCEILYGDFYHVP
jgi:hypothetical protein